MCSSDLAGTDAGTGQPLYRLQFTAAETGAANAFTVTSGGTDVLAAPGAAVVTLGRDASVLLYAGTAAETRLTSASNTFSNVLTGVDITVAADTAAGTVADIAIASDKEAVSGLAEALVKSLNGLFATISAKTAVTGSGDSVAGSILTGDGTIRAAKDTIYKAASAPIDGRSPSEIGISVTRYGTLEFDAEKFAKALAEDPEFVNRALTEISTRVEAAAKTVSDKYEGTLTTKITGQEKLINNWEDQVEDWDTRLSARRTQLERVYSQLEVTLSNMQAQSAWLSSQVAALPSSSTS